MKIGGHTYIEAGIVGAFISAAIFIGIDHANIQEAKSDVIHIYDVLDKRGELISEIRERLSHIETLLEQIHKSQKSFPK